MMTIPKHWPMATSLMYGGGLGRSLYDPFAEARQAADKINANRARLSLDGVLAEAPWVARRDVEEALTAFHKDAMGRIPSATRYPEAKPFVAQVLAYEKELRRLANLDDLGIAVAMSLNKFLLFRGRRRFGLGRPPAPAEKCRILLHLDTDRGPFLIKNVDDPAANWKPAPALPARLPRSEYWWDQVEWVADGVGSGMHIDEEPEELFPLPGLSMASEHAHDSPGVVDFFRRYSPFFGGGNFLVYDRKLRMAAIEKTSHSHCEVFPPEGGRWAHVSGMVCRDPGSPQGRHQKAHRDEYRRLYGLTDDNTSDAAFWDFCDAGERLLVERVRKLGARPRVKDIVELFLTPYPGGLCKNGRLVHPRQPVGEYTLWTYAHVFGENKYLRWQRGADLSAAPAEPEVCEFG
jgi:hypothetical protein